MATPSTSASIVNFVKKYPITLCAFSLLFMPSVHRLLLYFTPLLLSTAIFIVAMLSWGPSPVPSDQRGRKRVKRNEWDFNGSLKIYEEEEEEKADEEDYCSVEERVSKNQEAAQAQERHRALQELDPDLANEISKRVGTASSTGAIFLQAQQGAEPDPDLGGDATVGTASNGAIAREGRAGALHLHGDHVGSDQQRDSCVGAASSATETTDPDLNKEPHVEAAHHNHGSSPAAQVHQLQAAPAHKRHQYSLDHAKPAPKDHDKIAAGDHYFNSDDAGAEPDYLNYHDAADNQVNHSGDSDANQGDDYHDAEADLDGSEGCAAAHDAKSEDGASAPARVENDDLRAAIAELRQKLGLAQRAPFSDGEAHDHMHSEQRLQTLQAAA